jgi:hypothetical protein
MPAVATLDMLVDVMTALPKGTSPGPSGWTYEMIKAATETANSAMGNVLAFVNVIISGTLPHVPALLDCTLLGFEKPGGNGLRPIAIGETWLRLAGLCAMAACPGVGVGLAPLQLGVGIKGGSQILGHAIRTGTAADPECVTVQLDFRNAYNTLDRGAMLEAVKRLAPSLLPFAVWEYRQHSRLFAAGALPGTPPIMSQLGVKQGGPPSGLYFGATLQEPLEQIKLVHPGANPLAFLDDVSLQGSQADVTAAFPALCHLCDAIGLHINPAKCGVFSQNVQAAADTATALGIRHCVDGIVVTGTPIGTDAFVLAHVNAVADAACNSIDRVLEAPLATQDKYMLLRASAQMRVAHLLRLVPWRLVEGAIQRVEAKAAAAAYQIMERPHQGGASHTQMTLPFRHAGMGIRVTTEMEADAAHLAGVALTDTTMRPGPERYRPFAGPEAPAHTRVWQGLHAAASTLWPPEALPATQGNIDKFMSSAQRAFSRFTAQDRSNAMMATFDASTEQGLRDRARVLSCSTRSSSAWLDTLPTSQALTLSDADFRCAMRHRLGLTQLPANAPGVKCTCGHNMQAGDIDHAMTCRSLSGGAQLRHNLVNDTWCLVSHRAGIASSKEPVLRRLRGEQAAANATRPDSRGDLLLVLPSGLTVADVSVIHPAAATYVQAAQAAGGAAALREQAKRARYETADPNGYAFVPLAVETYGRLGKAAMELLNTLASAATAQGNLAKPSFVQNALRQLSIALCRGNGVMYRRGLAVLARAGGNSYMPGLVAPTSDVP